MLLERLDRYESATLMRGAQGNRRRFGVPPGGPVDRGALTPLTEAFEVWEIFCIAISEWRVNETGWLSCSGAAVKVWINGDESNPPVLVQAGDVMRILPKFPGRAAYIALSDNPIHVQPTQAKREVRVLPPIDKLDQRALFGHDFSISLSSSRHGWRLNEAVTGAKDLPRSEPCAPGVIQCTPNGQLIIIGPDGPTIGGYARIGAIIEEDLDCLAQIGFNQPFKFTK